MLAKLFKILHNKKGGIRNSIGTFWKNFWNAFWKSSKKILQFSKNPKDPPFEKWKNLKFILNFFCPRCSLEPPKMHFRSLFQKISTRFWMPPILLWRIFSQMNQKCSLKTKCSAHRSLEILAKYLPVYSSGLECPKFAKILLWLFEHHFCFEVGSGIIEDWCYIRFFKS